MSVGLRFGWFAVRGAAVLGMAAVLHGCGPCRPASRACSGSATITQFSASPLQGRSPLNVGFNLAARDSRGIASVLWFFEGGGEADEVTRVRPAQGVVNLSATHRFVVPGNYVVRARVLTREGCLTETPRPVVVTTSILKPPRIVSFAVSPGAGDSVPLSVTFTATAEDPGGGQIAEYLWDFGEGGGYFSTGPSSSVVHTYKRLGIYSVRVKVKNDVGLTATWFPPVQIPILLNIPGVSLYTSNPEVEAAAGLKVTAPTSVTTAYAVQGFAGIGSDLSVVNLQDPSMPFSARLQGVGLQRLWVDAPRGTTSAPVPAYLYGSNGAVVEILSLADPFHPSFTVPDPANAGQTKNLATLNLGIPGNFAVYDAAVAASPDGSTAAVVLGGGDGPSGILSLKTFGDPAALSAPVVPDQIFCNPTISACSRCASCVKNSILGPNVGRVAIDPGFYGGRPTVYFAFTNGAGSVNFLTNYLEILDTTNGSLLSVPVTDAATGWAGFVSALAVTSPEPPTTYAYLGVWPGGLSQSPNPVGLFICDVTVPSQTTCTFVYNACGPNNLYASGCPSTYSVPFPIQDVLVLGRPFPGYATTEVALGYGVNGVDVIDIGPAVTSQCGTVAQTGGPTPCSFRNRGASWDQIGPGFETEKQLGVSVGGASVNFLVANGRMGLRVTDWPSDTFPGARSDVTVRNLGGEVADGVAGPATAYVALGSAGVDVVDLTGRFNCTPPCFLSNIGPPGGSPASALVLVTTAVSSTLFATFDGYGICSYDAAVTQATTAPRNVSCAAMSTLQAIKLDAAGDWVLLGDFASGMIFSFPATGGVLGPPVATPSLAGLISFAALPGNPATAYAIDSSTLWASTQGGGWRGLDATGGATDLSSAPGALVGVIPLFDASSGLYIPCVETFDPTTGALLGRACDPSQSVQGQKAVVTTLGGIAFAGFNGPEFLYVFDVRDPASPHFVGRSGSNQIQGLSNILRVEVSSTDFVGYSIFASLGLTGLQLLKTSISGLP